MTTLFCIADMYYESNLPSQLLAGKLYNCNCGESNSVEFPEDNIRIVVCDGCHDSAPNFYKIDSMIEDYVPKTIENFYQSKNDNFDTNY